MKYDFDTVIDRRGSFCFKYDGLKEVYGREDLIPLWIADMDFQVAPQIKAAMQKRLDHGIFGYNQRLPIYYETVINWAKKRYGYEPQEDWIMTSPGIMPAVNLAVMQLTEPGDSVLIQTPVYQPFFSAVTAHNRKLVTNSLIPENGHYEIDFEDFEKKLKEVKLFILCSPHNPVGRRWTDEELFRMGTLCRQYNVPIISDEIHGDLVYNGAGSRSIAALEGMLDNLIVCFSPAKSFNLAGLATAIIIAKNPALREPLDTMLENLHLYMGNTFGIIALTAAYRESEDWLEELICYLQGNRDFLVDYIQAELPQLKVNTPEATYLAWIDFSYLGLTDDEVQKLLIEKAGIVLEPGIKYGIEGSGFQRLNFGCPRKTLSLALERMKKAIKEL
ncbi:MAG TPA: MalY/PatB family protein [Candidatus Syntrophosphaera sp.]|mgnify:FL=1|nr:MalY/PatB family protein [Candidatus Syntrophosphaera sp.]